MEDDRRNAWYLLGAAPLTAGGALAVGWLIAVDSSTAKAKPSYWGVPSYVAMGLILLGVVVTTLTIADVGPFSFRRSQHTEENVDLADLVVTYDGAIVPRIQASRGHERSAENLSDVLKNPEVAGDPISDGRSIPVDFTALQPLPSAPIATAQSSDLKITIDQEEWHVFDHRALIAGVKISVVNTSSQEHALKSVMFQAVEPWKLLMHDTEADRDRYQYQLSRAQFPGDSNAGETVFGWVWWMFESRLNQGRPGYVISIRDEVGNLYELSVPVRPPETFAKKPED